MTMTFADPARKLRLHSSLASMASRARAVRAHGAMIAACVAVVVVVFAVGVSIARRLDDWYLETSIVRGDTDEHCPIGKTSIWTDVLEEQC
jgi:hypothetical protein